MAARRSAMTQEGVATPRPGGLGTGGDRLEDGVAVLVSWVLVGDDDEPAALGGDPAHQRVAWRCPARRPTRRPR